jgi:Ca2+-binding EF-hand superfamily protein
VYFKDKARQCYSITVLVDTLCVCGDPLTEKEADQLMAAMDTNKDGYVDVNGNTLRQFYT